MEKKLIINEEEKKIILNLHKNAIKEEFLINRQFIFESANTQNQTVSVNVNTTQGQSLDINLLLKQLFDLLKQQSMMIYQPQQKQQLLQDINQLPKDELKNTIQQNGITDISSLAEFAKAIIGELNQANNQGSYNQDEDDESYYDQDEDDDISYNQDEDEDEDEDEGLSDDEKEERREARREALRQGAQAVGQGIKKGTQALKKVIQSAANKIKSKVSDIKRNKNRNIKPIQSKGVTQLPTNQAIKPKLNT
jgi:hypothetical protein